MWGSFNMLSLSVLVALVAHMAHTQVVCPWDDNGLELWSSPATWPSGQVPQFNDSVLIPFDKNILLDVPIPRLLTLTINGTLVWGNVDGIRMEISYVAVNGEFHIGSEECPFEKKADIFLYGTSSEAVVHPTFGQKFVGAASGSVLEMHGQPKKSWTKLTGTVTPNNGSCGFVYDSWNEKFNDEFDDGLRVVIWNPDGTVVDYGVFDTTSGLQEDVDNFAAKLQKLTAVGKVVAVSVRVSIGQPLASWEPLYQAIETLGGKEIRNVQDREPYVFVAVTGHPSTARETRISRLPTDDLLVAHNSVTIEARNLVFRAESATVASSGHHYTRFRVLTRKLAFPLVTVLDDVTSWHPGDQVVFTSTDFDWEQAEVKTIVECFDCGQNQFRVDGEFRYRHFGHVTYGIDQRAEVGLLSRNIRIEAEIQNDCYFSNEVEEALCTRFGYDTFGGHTRVNMGAFARIEGVELYHLGQHHSIGKYPLHFHMCDEVHGQYFRNNSIRDSFSRCITLHGTDYAEVSDNVCLNHLGHGIFLEDSAEHWNTINRNLVLGTKHGMLLLSDMRPSDCPIKSEFCELLSSFWISRPENYFIDNVAAGSDCGGMVFAFADVPLGPSYNRQIERGLFQFNMSAQFTKVAAFSGNVMHSNGKYGLWFDSRISYGQYHKDDFVPENGVIRTNLFYDPRDPPNENGATTETILSHLTFYKNNELDTWMRCGNIVITNSSYADTTTSISTGRSTTESSCDIRHSIFIGETENRGEPFLYINKSAVYDHLPDEEKPTHLFDRSFSANIPDAVQSAILMYQGPMYVDNCYFDRYFNWYYNDSFINTWGYRPVHASAALSMHRSNPYPLVPRSGTFNLKFGNCDGVNDAFRVVNGNETSPHWEMKDGTFMTTFRDYDGSITGIAGTQIVRDRSFFTGPECLSKPEWDMAICPYKYAQLVIRGEGGVLQSSQREEWAVLITRDDSLDDVINLEGTHGLKYPVQIHKSYTIRFNSTLGNAPTELEIKAKYGLERNDIIRIAVCLPKTTTSFKIKSTTPKINSRTKFPVWVNSLPELDADTSMAAYFWDQTNGYLYFKMSTNETFTSYDHDAAGDIIPEVTITRLDGGDSPAVCTMDNPPYQNPQVTPPQPVAEGSCSGPDSPKGLGAALRRDFTHPDPPKDTCADCPVADQLFTVRPSEIRGCFAQETYLNDFPGDATYLKRAMIQEFCINKCFQMDLPFAGLYSGTKCGCTSVVGRNGVQDESLCNRECSGDATQDCGGGFREVTVFTTGAAMAPAPSRCGPLNRGVYYQGKCLHLNYLQVDFWTAESMCQAQGGSLSKIDSEEKMRFIETYLLNVDLDVWFGARSGPSDWKFLDETVVTYGNWKTSALTPEPDMFLYLQKNNQYRWSSHPYDNIKLALCDISVDTSSAAASGDCGYRLQGTEFGTSNRCFASVDKLLRFEDATYMCKRMFGRMVSIIDAAEQADVESYINGINDTEKYWVSGNPTTAGHQMGYNRNIPRNLIEKPEDHRHKTVCVLDTQDTDGCFSGWTKNGDFCYLDTGVTTSSFSHAAAICNSPDESTFLKTWLSGSAWLDLRYNGVLDNIVKSNGETAPHSFWSNPDFLQTLSEGLCVAANVDTETWLHTPCSGGAGHTVVCEAPLVNL